MEKKGEENIMRSKLVLFYYMPLFLLIMMTFMFSLKTKYGSLFLDSTVTGVLFFIFTLIVCGIVFIGPLYLFCNSVKNEPRVTLGALFSEDLFTSSKISSEIKQKNLVYFATWGMITGLISLFLTEGQVANPFFVVSIIYTIVVGVFWVKCFRN